MLVFIGINCESAAVCPCIYVHECVFACFWPGIQLGESTAAEDSKFILISGNDSSFQTLCYTVFLVARILL